MPFSRIDRKTALLQAGKSQRDVAQAVGVDETVVSHVLAGRRWSAPDGLLVMRYLSDLFGIPMDEVFPGWERRRVEDRRQVS